MKKHLRLSSLFRALILCAFGYLLAVLSCSNESWLDKKSGRIETRCRLWPFSKSWNHEDRAFELYFSKFSPPHDVANWSLVSKESFFFNSDESYTEADSHLASQRYIIQADLIHGFNQSDRALISKEYFSRLKNSGISAAREYAASLLANGLPEGGP